jgi:hypothetical protein
MADASARVALLTELGQLLDAYEPARVVQSLDRQTVWAFLTLADEIKLESLIAFTRANIPAFVQFYDPLVCTIK